MKFIFLLLILFSANQLLAQTLKGIVLDHSTKKPISNAQLINTGSTSLTGETGKFKLNNVKVGDKFAVRMLGYETMEFTINNNIDSLTIFLKQSIFQLNEVMVRTNRNYKNDSLRLRKEYAVFFAYRPSKFTDMFIKVDPGYRSPFPTINPSSTASILKFDVLSALSFMGRKKNSVSKFKETLLKAEETNYVDDIFSAEKVEDITKLKGDSLVSFMNIYRPIKLTLQKMTGYELIQYIKKSRIEFTKP